MSPSPLVVDIQGIDLAGDGAGFAIVRGERVAVPFTIPGERVEIALPAFARGRPVADLLRVLRPSPHRVEAACRHFGPCGGCTWQHIAYGEQLRLKREALRALLQGALAARAPEVMPARPTPPMAPDQAAPWGFRNKVHFVFGAPARVGAPVMGHYRRASRSVLPVEECPVHAPEGNRVAFAARTALARATSRQRGRDPDDPGIVRHLVVRVAEASRRTLATLVVRHNDKALRPPVRAWLAGPDGPESLHLNVHAQPGPFLFGPETLRLSGHARIVEEVVGTSFLVSPTAFFQTNVRAAEVMAAIVLDEAGPARTALDLYAGAGLFALPLARRGVRVVAVEENAAAVEDGEASCRLNDVSASRCRFVCLSVDDLASGAMRRAVGNSADVVVLDPPRQGCTPAVLDWLTRSLAPPRVVYVSCNPEALVLDLRTMVESGYRAVRVTPVDMFPHTSHLEAVAVLERA